MIRNSPYNRSMDDALFKPLKPASLKEEFVLYMEELILMGSLKPGERFPPERKLAKKFGVSRPIVHEGILTLETRGLVTLRPRHGVIVNDYRKQGTLDLLLSLIKGTDHELGPDLTEDLEHVRILMEKDMVSLICNRKFDVSAGLRELKEINRQMSKDNQAEELAEQDFLFHLQLALASGNTIYALLTNTLKPAHMNLLTQFYQGKGVREKVVEYHNRLIAALSEKDEKKALLLIEKTDSYSGYD